MKTLQITILSGIIVVVVLEVLFALGLVAHAPKSVSSFDIGFLVVSILLYTSTDRWMKAKDVTFWKSFGKLPILYRIWIAVALYVLVIKVAYFAGFTAHAISEAL